jgi:NADPH:quinone reductase-like Zn-dependent oxidoreductase
MRAAVYRRFGGPDVVEVADVPRPAVGRDDVLVRVHASTVSAADHRARALDVPRGLRLPAAVTLGLFRPRRPVLGMDVAGVVEAVGDRVTRFRPGDEVVAMLGSAFGGHAELARVRQDRAIAPKPSGMTFEDAVTLVFGGLTAQAFLRQARLRPGATVLVNGASGAVGTAMVQLAVAAGARVTGVCSAANAPLVRSLGADRTVDYAVEDVTAEGSRYDVVVDCVGNLPYERAAHLVILGGALLLVIADLPAVLRAPARGRRSGIAVVTSPGRYRAEDLRHVVDLAEAGRYRPVRDGTYDLADIAEAHRRVDGGHKRGNVVVRIDAGLAT